MRILVYCICMLYKYILVLCVLLVYYCMLMLQYFNCLFNAVLLRVYYLIHVCYTCILYVYIICVCLMHRYTLAAGHVPGLHLEGGHHIRQRAHEGVYVHSMCIVFCGDV